MMANATMDDIRYVLDHLRPQDRQEIEAVTGQSAEEAIATIGALPYIALVIHQDEPVAIFGAMLRPDKTATMFRFATDSWPTVVREAIKFGKRAFLLRMWEAGVKQLDAVTLDVPEQTAWLKLFGAREDGRFERNGAKFVRFVVDRPDGPPLGYVVN